MAIHPATHPETRAYRASDEDTVELGWPWLCPARHLLGYIKRVGSFRRLFLAEGHVITGQAEIRCPVCGTVRIWPWGEEGSA